MFTLKVKVERHVVNLLNDRFKVVLDVPTLGILGLDDKVLRPCVVLDDAFVRWTRHPEWMLGFDARTHVVAGDISNEGNTSEGGGNDSNKSSWKF